MGKTMCPFKNLAKKVKIMGKKEVSQYERLLGRKYDDEEGSASTPRTPKGTVAVYVGEERRRFVIPMGYLSHPLFKILLEKTHDEFGFEQQSALVVPCSVTAFQEMVSVMQCSHGKFDLGNLVEELM